MVSHVMNNCPHLVRRGETEKRRVHDSKARFLCVSLFHPRFSRVFFCLVCPFVMSFNHQRILYAHSKKPEPARNETTVRQASYMQIVAGDALGFVSGLGYQ